MHLLLLSLHRLAVALWFGSVVFFTLSGVLIFNAYRDVSHLPAAERPLWLPLPSGFERGDLGDGFPSPLRLEQGSRAAGVAVGGVFPVYYALQAGSGVIVLIAVVLLRGDAATRWRIALAGLALASVLAGWWLEVRVSELRLPRNELTDRVICADQPDPATLEAARAARATFGRWHGYSLVQNFLTLGLVTALTLLPPAGRRDPA